MGKNAAEFDDFRHYLKEISGICLSDNKRYLVDTRIRRILADYELDSLNSLTDRIKRPSEKKLRQIVVDAMTTNETFWFRDQYPYTHLRDVVFPDLQQKGIGVRVWSAACSSGQEPFSISIIAEEFIRSSYNNANFSLDIQGTDLSSTILDHAKKGIYDKLSISRGMSDQRLRDFFMPKESDTWQLKPQVRNRVHFKALNLQDSFSGLGRFDIVFCRNVLIYFSDDFKQHILRKIHAVLKPGGRLFLGSSESLGACAELFSLQQCNPGIVFIAN